VSSATGWARRPPPNKSSDAPPRSEPPIPTLHGNTDGLKHSESKALLSLYDRRVPAKAFINPEVARRLTEVSRLVARQVGLVIDRRGTVSHVIVGDAHRLFIPDLSRARAGSGRFRGIRLVHTHLRGEPLTQDDVTDLSLLRLDAMIVVEAKRDGLPGFVEVATLRPEVPGELPYDHERRESVHGWEADFEAFITELEGRWSQGEVTRRVPGKEACIIIGVATRDAPAANASLDELYRLSETAGLQVMGRVLQMRKERDPRYVIGEGKLKEIVVRAMQQGAEVLVFDQELAPSQLRNIATDTELKVLDRTQLILDIFSQRARSREGKLQVELAQLRYRRPRLAIMPTAMSRLTGGIGGRGPGETKLEINKRRAEERQTRMEGELEQLGRNRDLRRARRKRVGLPSVAIVGYTNAGKSTLLNTMTRAQVDAEDKLFATLDPTSRRMRFPEEREIIITDTVGFIRNLPADLLHAFRSTLEETVEADLILHVCDAASPELDVHLAEVQKTLDSLGVADSPILLVLNKVDAVPPELWSSLRERYGGMLVSAQSGEGLEALLLELERRLFRAGARQRSVGAHEEHEAHEAHEGQEEAQSPEPA
jgi:GTP-binding protein HflX